MLNWEAIARSEAHPVRLAILERMLSPPPAGDPGWSASTLAEALGLGLATTSLRARASRGCARIALCGSACPRCPRPLGADGERVDARHIALSTVAFVRPARA
jgi:hypothetical protein